MCWTKTAFAALACFTLCFASGCVGPMGCGPAGTCGPLAMNSCGGCGDCQGCGELYIDPWINEPADCCDPCDCCGNHNGQSCGKCRSVFSGVKSLWGYRCDSGCDDTCGGCDTGCTECSSGCDSCGDVGCGGDCCEPTCGFLNEPVCGCEAGCDGCSSCSGDSMSYISSEPVLSQPIVKATPTREPYKPARTKQIFRPKSTIAGEGSTRR
ncbi:hypothetical protein Pla22_43980 [Rubripirellula amarantea]|uniref:Stigma-specific protein, Stig1 n=1 Tax=Rubripirellula amarantea TaxID=2527999 RepID=A0A5C5WE11_9BACT|nr:hypothetical protein Pla22_43980 [Rubripirellula amarantea]